MLHVKLFEEFQYDSNFDGGNPQTIQPKKYIYYIKETGKETFDAQIRDEDGKVIFKFDDSLLKSDRCALSWS